MKAFMRGMALRVPPIGRLYDFAMQQARENQERATTIAALTTGRESQPLSELSAVVEERDALELQLYVMRSDKQRASVRNHELSVALRAAEDKAQVAVDQARAAQERATVAEHASAERAATALTPYDLSLLYAKIAGRMTLLHSEIIRLQPHPSADVRDTALYLDLLERSITGMLAQDAAMDPWTKDYDPDTRMIGRDWPSTAQTMIGLARMRNLRVLTERVVQDGIPGDLLEAGVWRGGACMLMRGILKAYGITDRVVWVADSFAGLPPADPAAYPADAGDQHATYDALRVSMEEVQANFQRYGLLDRQVRFLKGWFSETLATAPIERLAILRLDGDMYSSTMQTLDALYHKVTPGGYVIVDDYILSGCRQAVDDFRDRHGIGDELNDVDGAAVFWRKS